MSRTHRASARRATVATALSLVVVLCGCTDRAGGSTSRVDPNDGTVNLTIDGRSTQHQPLVCVGKDGHKTIQGALGERLDSLSATLTSDRTAYIEVTRGGSAQHPVTLGGNASVSLTSTVGPVGSLAGTVTEDGRAVPVSAQFFCSSGGGVYTADSVDPGLPVYFTVSHDGRRVVDLVANTVADPNVQLRASDIRVSDDGTFSVTAPVVARDPSGLVAQGRPASLRGWLDGTGRASGTVRWPASVATGDPWRWTAAVAGPIAPPIFPHAALDTHLVTAAAVASDPVVTEPYPGSTIRTGTPPGSGEQPHEDYANLPRVLGGVDTSFSAWEAHPAVATRELQAPASRYDVAAWYVQRLTGLGWRMASLRPGDGGGRRGDLTFLQGDHRVLFVSFTRNGWVDATQYSVELEEDSPGNDLLRGHYLPVAPYQAITPCVPGEPAKITVSGTLSGTSTTTCIDEVSQSAVPECTFPAVGLAIGRMQLDILSDRLSVTNERGYEAILLPVSPPQQLVANGTARISGTYEGGGYQETVMATFACRPVRN